MAILVFPGGALSSQGFISPAIDRNSSNDERLLRELIQNCIDASSRRPAVVALTYASLDTPAIPHYGELCDAFSQVRSTRYRTAGQHEKTEIDRYQDTLARRKTPTLFCVGESSNLDAANMRALYSQGTTTKRFDIGLGSFGLGHLQFIASSDLRFVLYAGMNKSGGTRTEVYGGHAILATHAAPSLRSMRSADGYVIDRHSPIGGGSFSVSTVGIPSSIPMSIRGLLDYDIGSLTAVLGYRRHDGLPLRQLGDHLLSCIAKHYWLAIERGQLMVTYRRADSQQDEPLLLDRSSLGGFLERVAHQNNRSAKVVVPGSHAYRSWRTWQCGRKVECDDLEPSSEIRYLRLKERSRTRISVIRDGMFISSNVRGLNVPRADEHHPFDAVVSIDPTFGPAGVQTEGPYIWLRDAERLSHLELALQTAQDRKTHGKLVTLIDEIAGILERSSRTLSSNEIRALALGVGIALLLLWYAFTLAWNPV